MFNLPDEIIHSINEYACQRISDKSLREIEQRYVVKKMMIFDKSIVDGWLFSNTDRRPRHRPNTLHNYVEENVSIRDRYEYIDTFKKCNCDISHVKKSKYPSLRNDCHCKTYKEILEKVTPH